MSTDITFLQQGGTDQITEPVPTLRRKWVVYTGSDTLKEGYLLCYDSDDTDDSDKLQKVEKPSYSNYQDFAGVVVSIGTQGYVQIAMPDGDTPGALLWCDQNLSKGDLLGVQPGTYAAKRGGFGVIVGKVMEDTDRSSTAGTVLSRYGTGVPYTSVERMRSLAEIDDDFYAYAAGATGWNLQEDGSSAGTVGVIASEIGEFTLYADDTDNDEAYLYHNAEFTMDRSWYLYGRMKLTEAATNEADFIFGLTDDDIASEDVMGDNGTGPQADGDHAVFFKVEGGTVWQAETSSSTNQSTDTDAGTRDGSYHEFEIVHDADAGTITFYIDGSSVHSDVSTDNTFPSGSDLQVVVGVKGGATTSVEELVTIDRVYAVQGR